MAHGNSFVYHNPDACVCAFGWVTYVDQILAKLCCAIRIISLALAIEHRCGRGDRISLGNSIIRCPRESSGACCAGGCPDNAGIPCGTELRPQKLGLECIMKNIRSGHVQGHCGCVTTCTLMCAYDRPLHSNLCGVQPSQTGGLSSDPFDPVTPCSYNNARQVYPAALVNSRQREGLGQLSPPHVPAASALPHVWRASGASPHPSRWSWVAAKNVVHPRDP